MGWQTPRQMGAAAVGRRSNHIHLVRFPVFPCSCFLQQLINRRRRRRPENLRSLLARRQFGKNTPTHAQYCRLALPEDHSGFVHVRPSTLLTTGGDGARKTFPGSLAPNICLPNFSPKRQNHQGLTSNQISDDSFDFPLLPRYIFHGLTEN